MIDRIFKSWKSTLLGFIIIGASLAFIQMDKVGVLEGFTSMGVGLLLFFKKDGNDTK